MKDSPQKDPHYNLPIEIMYTNRKKTIAIQVLNNQIRVLAPKRTSKRYIYSVIGKKEKWIIDQIQKQHLIISQKKRYVQDEKISFLGKQYTLRICQNLDYSTRVAFNTQSTNIQENIYPYFWEEFSQSLVDFPSSFVKITNSEIEITSPHHNLTEQCIKNILKQWYISIAQKILVSRTHYYASKIGVNANKVIVKYYKSRWGACSINKDISYNWKIILAPIKIIDYLIIHELCHIKEHNHSSQFWNLVAAFDPSYKSHKTWLRDNGHTLEI